LDRRRRGHGRAGEMGARAGALPADEVAIGRRDAALARRHALAVGGDAHRAAGLAPFEAGLLEDAVEPFGLGLTLHALRARYDPGVHMRRFLPALDDRRGGAQVGDAAVGARADEHPVDLGALDRLGGPEPPGMAR